MRIPIRSGTAPGVDPAYLLFRNWWAVGLRGLAALAFGILALLWPGVTLLTLALLLAAYFLVDGVLAIAAGIRAIRRDERWWPSIVEGVANIAAGIVVLLLPQITVLALMYLLAIWAIATGALMVFGGMYFGGAPRWLLVVAGALSILLGVVMITEPALGLLALVWWIASYWVAFGIVLLAAAAWLHSRNSYVPPLAA
jgi:uncharacterized membrane protein HdeD (DUF308 family)